MESLEHFLPHLLSRAHEEFAYGFVGHEGRVIRRVDEAAVPEQEHRVDVPIRVSLGVVDPLLSECLYLLNVLFVFLILHFWSLIVKTMSKFWVEEK